MKKILIGLFFLSLISPVFAGNVNRDDLQEIPGPPPLPEPSESGESMPEPEVTIIRRGDATVEEYRVNGALYMIKVTPGVGKPYYLVDRDGDGLMDSRVNDIHSNMIIPEWVLFSW